MHVSSGGPRAWWAAAYGRMPGWVRLHPRLFVAVAGGMAAYLLVPVHNPRVRFLVSFDVGAILWLLLAGLLVLRCDAAQVRCRAQGDDEGAWVALLVAVLATGSSLVAVIMEAGAPSDGERWTHVALAVGTLIASWLFFHTLFAFHYAREYYDAELDDSQPALGFPGGGAPDYWDFLYFAFNIGTASQTADVTVNVSRLRRFVLGHQIASYLFNTAVIALGVNVAAALM
jgi:uncharacterized membrane protein